MTKPSSLLLQNSISSILNLYREGILSTPAALHHFTEHFFNTTPSIEHSPKEPNVKLAFQQEANEIKANQNSYQTGTTHNYFLEHTPHFEYEDVAVFYHNLKTLLGDTNAHVVYKLNSQQFTAIKTNFDLYVSRMNEQLIIYSFGEQIHLETSFIKNGDLHLDYFQWENLYGLVKIEKQKDEEISETDLLVYFADRHEKNLEQCIEDLLHQPQVQIQPEEELPVKNLVLQAAPTAPQPKMAPSSSAVSQDQHNETKN